MASLFGVRYGSSNREAKIREYLEIDPTLSVILAAVHFEWTLKRTILKLSHSYTDKLKKDLQEAWSKDDLEKIWHKEIGSRINKSRLSHIINTSRTLESNKKDKNNPTAKDIRGEIVHGNGITSKRKATQAVNDYLEASNKLFQFALKNGKNLDRRLATRKAKS